MNFNTFLLRLGFEPDNFKNSQIELIQFNDGFIYEVEQIVGKRICPYCSSSDVAKTPMTELNTNPNRSIKSFTHQNYL